jgi:hypothetical protein
MSKTVPHGGLAFVDCSTGRIGAALKSGTSRLSVRYAGIAIAFSPMRDAFTRMSPPTIAARDEHLARLNGERELTRNARGRCRNRISDRKGKTMLRHFMIGLAAVTLVGATLIPDDAFARRGGGGARVGGGARMGGAHFAGGRAHVSRPIAGRGVAYRGGAYRGGAYRGAYYGGGYRPGWGAAAAGAAVGAAAVGAGYYGGGYYGNYGNYGYGGYGSSDCYRDSRGRVICPNQYQY